MKWGMTARLLGLLALGVVAVIPSFGANDTLKIAYIDPLSGGGASIGEVGLKTFQFLADELNAKGGLLGKKVEIVGYDNKLNPQESLVQIQKAIDSGIRIITQGNGSSVAAAISDFVAKYNERNPGKEIVYFNYAAVDPVLTNDKCTFWHFRWDANSDIKMEALTNYMKGRTNIKKIYLINQDYSFGHSVRDAAKAMLAKKLPNIQIVGEELHPLLRITDFAPYIAKIKASGADSVITGNWGQDFALLMKAAADAGLQVDWYTYYAGGTGGPTAMKQANLNHRVFAIGEGFANIPHKASQDFEKGAARQVRLRPLLPARRQPDAHDGGGGHRGEVRRAGENRRQARGHEVRGVQRRRGLHARRGSPVLPAHVHRLVRRPEGGRTVRRGEYRLGLAIGGRHLDGEHQRSDHVQDGAAEELTA